MIQRNKKVKAPFYLPIVKKDQSVFRGHKKSVSPRLKECWCEVSSCCYLHTSGMEIWILESSVPSLCLKMTSGQLHSFSSFDPCGNLID